MSRAKKKAERKGRAKARRTIDTKTLVDAATASTVDTTDLVIADNGCTCCCDAARHKLYDSWSASTTPLEDPDIKELYRRRSFYLMELYNCQVSFEEQMIDVLVMARRHAAMEVVATAEMQVSWLRELRILIPGFVGGCNEWCSEHSYLGLVKTLRHLKNDAKLKQAAADAMIKRILDISGIAMPLSIVENPNKSNLNQPERGRTQLLYMRGGPIERDLSGLLDDPCSRQFRCVVQTYDEICEGYLGEYKNRLSHYSMLSDIASDLVEIPTAATLAAEASKQGISIDLLHSTLVMTVLDIASELLYSAQMNEADLCLTVQQVFQTLHIPATERELQAEAQDCFLHLLLAWRDTYLYLDSLDPRSARKWCTLEHQRRSSLKEISKLGYTPILTRKIWNSVDYLAAIGPEGLTYLIRSSIKLDQSKVEAFYIKLLFRRVPELLQHGEKENQILSKYFLDLLRVKRSINEEEDRIEKAEVNKKGESVLNFRGRHAKKADDFLEVLLQDEELDTVPRKSKRSTTRAAPHNLVRKPASTHTVLKLKSTENLLATALLKAKVLIDTVVSIAQDWADAESRAKNRDGALDFRPLASPTLPSSSDVDRTW